MLWANWPCDSHPITLQQCEIEQKLSESLSEWIQTKHETTAPSLSLSDLLERNLQKNTYKYEQIQNVKMIQSTLHIAVIDLDKMDHNANRRWGSGWEMEGFPTCSEWNTRIGGGWGRGSRDIHPTSSWDRREEQGVGGWPSSTLTYVQLHPGSEIRGESKVGGPQARTEAWVCMANVRCVPLGLTAVNGGGVRGGGDDVPERIHVLHC